MGLFDWITGGDSNTEEVKYPTWYDDPKFTGSQEFLDQYSRDLLSKGPNDYYAPIGQYGTPEFYNHLQQGNAATLMGVNEQLAKTGRARGGRGGEIAAQALGDTNADLLYKDYLRAMQGREKFFDTGLNVQDSVRKAGFVNQGARNSFNVGGAEFDMNKAIYGDQYERQQGADIGKFISGVAPIAGAGIGALFGNPVAGYQIGSMISGGAQGNPESGVSWIDAIMGSKKTASGSTDYSGVSDTGKIGSLSSLDPDTLQKILAGIA